MEKCSYCSCAAVPKTPNPSQLSDFGPIALTLLVMKYFERLVKKYIISKAQHLLDRLQLASQESRGVEDAIATFLHLLLSHLEKVQAHAKILVRFIMIFLLNLVLLPELLIFLVVESSRSEQERHSLIKRPLLPAPLTDVFYLLLIYFVHKLLL